MLYTKSKSLNNNRQSFISFKPVSDKHPALLLKISQKYLLNALVGDYWNFLYITNTVF